MRFEYEFDNYLLSAKPYCIEGKLPIAINKPTAIQSVETAGYVVAAMLNGGCQKQLLVTLSHIRVAASAARQPIHSN